MGRLNSVSIAAVVGGRWKNSSSFDCTSSNVTWQWASIRPGHDRGAGGVDHDRAGRHAIVDRAGRPDGDDRVAGEHDVGAGDGRGAGAVDQRPVARCGVPASVESRRCVAGMRTPWSKPRGQRRQDSSDGGPVRRHAHDRASGRACKLGRETSAGHRGSVGDRRGLRRRARARGVGVVRSTRTDLQPAATASASSTSPTRHAWDALMADIGPLDGLVTSAGIRTRGMIVDTSLDEWERHLRVNVTGTWLAIRAFLRAIPAGDRSPRAIVTIASVNATIAVPGQAHYVASKGAIASLTRAAALEGAPLGVRVNSIAPGPIRTPMAGGAPRRPGPGRVAHRPRPARSGRRAGRDRRAGRVPAVRAGVVHLGRDASTPTAGGPPTPSEATTTESHDDRGDPP